MNNRPAKSVTMKPITSPANSGPLIDTPLAAFLQTGVAICVAACDRELDPTLARAAGCRVSEDRRNVTIFLSATQGAPVLQCIRENGRLAVVFGQPSTNRTVQLKGIGTKIGVPQPEDWPIIEGYRDAFVRDVQLIGFEEALTRTLLAMDDLVSLHFTPDSAYLQTPGPKAGECLNTKT